MSRVPVIVQTGKYVTLVAVSLCFVLPLVIMAFTSLKTSNEILFSLPLELPKKLFNAENYIYFFQHARIPLAFRNSLILVVCGVGGNVVLGSMAAFALGRFEFALKKPIIGLYFLAMIIPGIVTEVARYKIVYALGIMNTLMAPTILYVGSDVVQIYLFLQYASSIPRSLDESAMIEGASYLAIFYRIFVPLLRPAIATMAIVKSVGILNDLYVPYLYMPSPSLVTITTALLSFKNYRTVMWNYMSAGIITLILPSLVIYILFHKQIFSGVVMGAVKE